MNPFSAQLQPVLFLTLGFTSPCSPDSGVHSISHSLVSTPESSPSVLLPHPHGSPPTWGHSSHPGHLSSLFLRPGCQDGCGRTCRQVAQGHHSRSSSSLGKVPSVSGTEASRPSPSVAMSHLLHCRKSPAPSLLPPYCL